MENAPKIAAAKSPRSIPTCPREQRYFRHQTRPCARAASRMPSHATCEPWGQFLGSLGSKNFHRTTKSEARGSHQRARSDHPLLNRLPGYRCYRDTQEAVPNTAPTAKGREGRTPEHFALSYPFVTFSFGCQKPEPYQLIDHFVIANILVLDASGLRLDPRIRELRPRGASSYSFRRRAHRHLRSNLALME